MKISVAQTRPFKGNIGANIEAHKQLIALAIKYNADAIFFPELSITGYEPELAKTLATQEDDKQFGIFQDLSDKHNITIGIGLPTLAKTGIRISMLLFQPHSPRQTYSKQELHSDEFPYFVKGEGQVVLTINQVKVAPAICYESMLINHSTLANKLGAEVYMASVAKTKTGVENAMLHYPTVAKKFSMPVLMSNCVGRCDNFDSVGQSAIWTKNGKLVGQLDDQQEGILVFDTITEEVITQTL